MEAERQKRKGDLKMKEKLPGPTEAAWAEQRFWGWIKSGSYWG
jgi:hypothetical protein